MELHWLARDFELVYECRWVLQRAVSPMLRLDWRCYLSSTPQTLRLHVRMSSIDVLLEIPSEASSPRILFSSAIMRFH